MIHDLRLAMALHGKHRIREFVVTHDVFRQVLRERRSQSGGEPFQINSLHDSLSYRYVNRVTWRGILFIHLSNVLVSTEPEWTGAGR